MEPNKLYELTKFVADQKALVSTINKPDIFGKIKEKYDDYEKKMKNAYSADSDTKDLQTIGDVWKGIFSDDKNEKDIKDKLIQLSTALNESNLVISTKIIPMLKLVIEYDSMLKKMEDEYSPKKEKQYFQVKDELERVTKMVTESIRDQIYKRAKYSQNPMYGINF